MTGFHILIAVVSVIVAITGLFLAWRKYDSDLALNKVEWFEFDSYRYRPTNADLNNNDRGFHYKSMYFVNRKAVGSVGIEVLFQSLVLQTKFNPEISHNSEILDGDRTRLSFNLPPGIRLKAQFVLHETVFISEVICKDTKIKQSYYSNMSSNEIANDKNTFGAIQYFVGFTPMLLVLVFWLIGSGK